jgi:hypothetical protein
MDERELDMVDLCTVILDGWHNRTQAHDDLKAYHGKKLEIMCAEIGVVWRDDWNELCRAWGDWPLGASTCRASASPPYVLRTIYSNYRGIQEPMSGISCYSYATGEEAVHARHLSLIRENTVGLRGRWREVLLELLLLRWPEAIGRTTTWKRLRKLGLPEAPDGCRIF